MGLSLFNLVIYLRSKRIYCLLQTRLALCALLQCVHITVFSFNVSPMSGRKTSSFRGVPVHFQAITLFQKEQQDFKAGEILGFINTATVAS